MTNELVKGEKYDVNNLELIGWTEGDGTDTAGYHIGDYFDADNKYRGADLHGIEPIVTDIK